MNAATIDRLLGGLQRVGQAGALPKGVTVPQLVDELQRELGALAVAVRSLLMLVRSSPDFTKDGDLFLIDCRSGGNVLTTAQATAQGYGAVAGLAVFNHGKGYKLDRAAYSLVAMTATVGVVNGQAARTGAAVVWKADQNRTVFQVDADLATNLAVVVACCFPSIPPPTTLQKGTATQTGASTPQLGLQTMGTQVAGLP